VDKMLMNGTVNVWLLVLVCVKRSTDRGSVNGTTSVVRVLTRRTRGPSYSDTRLDTCHADVRSSAVMSAVLASWLFTHWMNTRDSATLMIGRFHAPSVDLPPSVSIYLSVIDCQGIGKW